MVSDDDREGWEADVNGAMGDLLQINKDLRARADACERLLTMVGSRLAGWTVHQAEMERLKKLPGMLDDYILRKQREVECLNDQIAAMKETFKRTVEKRERARKRRYAERYSRKK